MPDDQLLLPEQKQRLPFRDELRRERLGIEAELTEMKGTASLQNAASRNPMFLDPKHDGETDLSIQSALKAYFPGKALADLSSMEKNRAYS